MKENYAFLHVPLLKSDENFSVTKNLLLYLVVHTALHNFNLCFFPFLILVFILFFYMNPESSATCNQGHCFGLHENAPPHRLIYWNALSPVDESILEALGKCGLLWGELSQGVWSLRFKKPTSKLRISFFLLLLPHCCSLNRKFSATTPEPCLLACCYASHHDGLGL